MKPAVLICLPICLTVGLSGCAAFNHADPRAQQIDTFIGNDLSSAHRHNAAVDRILGRRVEAARPVADSRGQTDSPVDCSKPVPYEDRILRCS